MDRALSMTFEPLVKLRTKKECRIFPRFMGLVVVGDYFL